jgi:hypothetical protein
LVAVRVDAAPTSCSFAAMYMLFAAPLPRRRRMPCAALPHRYAWRSIPCPLSRPLRTMVSSGASLIALSSRATPVLSCALVLARVAASFGATLSMALLPACCLDLDTASILGSHLRAFVSILQLSFCASKCCPPHWRSISRTPPLTPSSVGALKARACVLVVMLSLNISASRHPLRHPAMPLFPLLGAVAGCSTALRHLISRTLAVTALPMLVS